MNSNDNPSELLSVDLAGHSYDIHIGTGLFASLVCYIPFSLDGRKVFVLTDENVQALYADQILEKLNSLGAETHLLSVSGGEESKSFSVYERVSNEILSHKVTRDSVLVALGGGVVGDLGGFISSTIVRGIPYIQIPTTLLAQVDSSVGGKTAINTKFGKNLVGTFYQPQSVIIDLKVLKTLPPRDYKAGVAEVVKYGLLYDERFLGYLKDNVDALNRCDSDVCGEIVRRSCEIKAQIVSEDEKETSGKRALLNLGHTFGHALELIAGYNGDVLHGEAVSVGMVMALQASHDIGLDVSQQDVDDSVSLLKSLGLPVSFDDLGLSVDPEQMYDLMLGDKKATKDGIGFILLREVGEAIVRKDLSQDFVLQLIKKFI